MMTMVIDDVSESRAMWAAPVRVGAYVAIPQRHAFAKSALTPTFDGISHFVQYPTIILAVIADFVAYSQSAVCHQCCRKLSPTAAQPTAGYVPCWNLVMPWILYSIDSRPCSWPQ